jgi:hypothetical protein
LNCHSAIEDYWIRTLGVSVSNEDTALGLTLTGDDSVVLAGYSNTAPKKSAFIVKVRSNSTIDWGLELGEDIVLYSLVNTIDNGLIAVGRRITSGPADDVLLVTLDA